MLKEDIKINIVLAAAMVALLFSFMIRTVVLRVTFALSFFIITLIMLFLLFHDTSKGKEISCKLRIRPYISWIYYVIAMVSSLMIIFLPPVKYNLNDVWLFFSSLNLLEILRAASGYYILTIFPGYVVYRTFISKKFNNSCEKLSIIIALSYIISIAISLLLCHTIRLTIVNYLYILWIFAVISELLHYRRVKKHIIPNCQSTTNSLGYMGLFILTCFLLVFSSYLITLLGSPTSTALGGDIADYVLTANAFVKSYQFDVLYIWFQIFIGTASILTGLHPLHAFIGMQFLIVLFPLSFYTFVLRIFNDSKLATIGTAIATITGGLSSIGMLWLFPEYDMGNVLSTLWILRAKTQNWPWLSNHFFIVATMDWSLLMLGLGLIYSFIKGKQTNRSYSLILGSLFLASTFFTHNIVSIIIFLMTIFTFSVLDYKYMRRAVLSFLSVILAIVLFDLLSYNFFINTLINYYLHYQVFFAGSLLFPYQHAIILFFTFLLLLLIIPKIVNLIRKRVKLMKNDRFLSTTSSLCMIIMLLLSAISIVMILINFSLLNYYEETIFPWYVYILRFTPFLQLAIVSIPLTLKSTNNEKRLGAWLMWSWVISTIWIIILHMFFPSFATELLVNRVLMSAYLPLGALSALLLISLNQINVPRIRFKFKGSHTTLHVKQILGYFLIILLGFSFLSHAYSLEFFYQGNLYSTLSDEERNLYEYLENLPPEKTYLTYNNLPYKRISSLTTHKTYAYYQYGDFTSWPIEIMLTTSSPEVAYHFLYKLGITHVILTKQDLATLTNRVGSAFMFMLNFFPIVFNNSFATVYSVPNHLLNDSLNYMLIKPVSKYGLNMIKQSLIYDVIKQDNLRIVGGPATFKLENATIIQEVQGIRTPRAQYLQLYRGIVVPTRLSPVVSFKLKGTANALFNIGFYDVKRGWRWLSKEAGLPSNFFDVPNNWTEMEIDLASILGQDFNIIHIDFVATSSDGLPAKVEWKNFEIFRSVESYELVLNNYNFAYNALIMNDIPFTILEDYKVSKLSPNHVYLFPSSWTTSMSNNDFIGYVKAGAHIIIMHDSAASDDNELLNILGLRPGEIVSVSSVSIGDETFIFTSNEFVANFTVVNAPYPHKVISYYLTSENSSIPLVFFFSIGNGSLTFINLPKDSIPNIIHANIITNLIKKIVTLLPKSIPSNTLKSISYPEDLFKLGNPNLINIYRLKGLSDYIYAFSDVQLKGNISILSSYIILDCKNLNIRRITIQNASHREVLENISVTNLYIAGSHNTTLITQNATVYGLGDELPIIKIFSPNHLRIYVNTPSICLTVKQNDEEKTLNISESYVEFEFTLNVTIYLRLRKPFVMLAPGSLDTDWKGVFWYNRKMFTTVATAEHFPIVGHYSFQILHASNVNLFLINDIQDIDIKIRQSQYWK